MAPSYKVLVGAIFADGFGDLRRVKCFVLAHFLLHNVLHNPRVESLASLLIRHMELFRIVGQWLALILATTLALSLITCGPLEARFLILTLCKLILLPILVAHLLFANVTMRRRTWHRWELVNDAHFCQLGCILKSLKLRVEELRTRHLLLLRISVSATHFLPLSSRVTLFRH